MLKETEADLRGDLGGDNRRSAYHPMSDEEWAKHSAAVRSEIDHAPDLCNICRDVLAGLGS